MSETINRDRLVRFLANVDQEILNMCSGEGKHRPGVLRFEQGKNSAPVMNRLEILKSTPTQKNLDAFLELAAQDFGAPTGDFFKDHSHAIFTQEEARKVPFVKAFDVSIKDAFYDMFKTARIAMEPKQVERIETIALGLAQVIESKIATAVGFQVGLTVRKQLGALVDAQKKQEAAQEKVRAAEVVTQVKEATATIVAKIDEQIDAEEAQAPAPPTPDWPDAEDKD